MTAIAPLFALAAGLLLQDCVLLAGGALLGLHAFHFGMDGALPMASWRVVARCWAAGWVALIAAALLLIEVASVMAGRWQGANAQPWLAFLSLTAAVALAWAAQHRAARDRRGGAACLFAGFGVACLAWVAHAEGLQIAPCLFALVAALVAAVAGWQLARATAEGLLEADRLR